MLICRRPIGTPCDGSVQEVDWLIEASVANLLEHGENELARLRAALGSDGRLHVVELSAGGKRSRIRRFLRVPGTDMRMRCNVRARGGGPAVLDVDRTFKEALAVASPRHELGESGPAAWDLLAGSPTARRSLPLRATSDRAIAALGSFEPVTAWLEDAWPRHAVTSSQLRRVSVILRWCYSASRPKPLEATPVLLTFPSIAVTEQAPAVQKGRAFESPSALC
jgi:hypothetical protein